MSLGIQPEVRDLELRIQKLGGSIDNNQLVAASGFVEAAKRENYWDNVLEWYPYLGNEVISAFEKLKYHTPAGPSLVMASGVAPALFKREGLDPVVGGIGDVIDTKFVFSTMLPSFQEYVMGIFFKSQGGSSIEAGAQNSVSGSEAVSMWAEVPAGRFRYNHGVPAEGNYVMPQNMSIPAHYWMWITNGWGLAYQNQAQVGSSFTANSNPPDIGMRFLGRQLRGIGPQWSLNKGCCGYIFDGTGLTEAQLKLHDIHVHQFMSDLRRA